MFFQLGRVLHARSLAHLRRATLGNLVQGMTLNCIGIFIVTGSSLYCCVMRPASQRFFIHSCIFLRILIISYLVTFLGTNSLSVLMCRKAVNQSINQSTLGNCPMCQGSNVISCAPCCGLVKWLRVHQVMYWLDLVCSSATYIALRASQCVRACVRAIFCCSVAVESD